MPPPTSHFCFVFVFSSSNSEYLVPPHTAGQLLSNRNASRNQLSSVGSVFSNLGLWLTCQEISLLGCSLTYELK